MNRYLKAFFQISLLFSFFFIFMQKKPISLEDVEVSLLYVCDLQGNFVFDEEGQKGIAVLSELKRRENEKFLGNRGISLLVTSGRFTEDTVGTNISLLSKVPFDAALIGEEELSYLEENPNLQKLKLPIIARRTNKIASPMEKIVSSKGINLWIGGDLSVIDPEKVKNINAFFVFKENNEKFFTLSDEEIEKRKKVLSRIQSNKPNIPIFIVSPSSNENSYSYEGFVYQVKCPLGNTGEIGKLSLYYRQGELIRQKQGFVQLNTKKRNGSWIEPNESLLENDF
ncbi:MAG: hypothetical protein H7A23_23155 [Leptospiraceae bacterium]|nr:hypothetical protein [Leptospiraceae bacterium]MCP5497465.1 hypothetical protein [Leptospiraceae bacterium]